MGYRNGSQVDAESLTKDFTQLGFEVVVENNRTIAQMLAIVIKGIMTIALSHLCCYVIVIVTVQLLLLLLLLLLLSSYCYHRLLDSISLEVYKH